MNYIKANPTAINDFDLCNTVKQIVLWHRKYTPWIPDSCILSVYIPRYIEQGKTIKDTDEEIPRPSVEEQYKAMIQLQEKIAEEKKHLDGEKERYIKEYNLPKVAPKDELEEEALQELKEYKDSLNPKKQLDMVDAQLVQLKTVQAKGLEIENKIKLELAQIESMLAAANAERLRLLKNISH